MQLLFPYETIRESQKDLIEEIQNTIKNKSSLIAHAPTGLGKSSAALAPAVTVAIENKLTVIFITPKHTQHKIAIETLKAIKQKFNLDFTTIDLIGKRNMCAQPNAHLMHQAEFSDYCKKLVEDGQCLYYNNVKNNQKLNLEASSLLSEIQKQTFHVEELKEISSKRKLCPYEITILLGQKAKVIIADYHHILNTSIRNDLLEKINKSLSEIIIIFDEAHQIPGKCRDLLSSELSTLTIELASKEAKTLGLNDIAQDILKLKEILEDLSRKKTAIDQYESLIKKDEFTNEIKKFVDYKELIDSLQAVSDAVSETKKRSFANSVSSFLINWEGPDHSFTRILNKGFTEKGQPIVILSYKCLDPSLIIKPIVSESYSSIFMSGTLNPLEMYKDLFGIDAKCAEYKNPFPKNNKLNIIVPDTTTKFTARSPEMYRKIAEHCSSIVNIVPGNTAVFFPSYKIRDDVNEYFKNLCTKTTFLETPNLSKQERTELIERFKQYGNVGAVLLAASAGSFGEGIDIEKNILKSVIVVGIPLDKPDLETQELIKYYDLKFKKGWDYGYIMPALIKTFQNAGRCIRSETDKGVIVYLDQRYTWENYFKCFPKDSYLKITKEPLPKINEFFSQSF